MPTVARMAWMAGIIDLKGRLIFKNNKTRATQQVVLAVQTKEEAVLLGLAELTGTTPELQAARSLPSFMRKGCTEHCPEKHIHANDYPHGAMPANGRWTITGASMAVILHNLKPYLMVDRGYDLAVEHVVLDVALEGRGSGAVTKSLARLRALGWKMSTAFEEAVERAEKSRPVTRDEVMKMIEAEASS